MCLCSCAPVCKVELGDREDNVNPVDRREPAGQTSHTSDTVEYPESGNNSNYVDPAEPLH